jgi:hypothetical protein
MYKTYLSSLIHIGSDLRLLGVIQAGSLRNDARVVDTGALHSTSRSCRCKRAGIVHPRQERPARLQVAVENVMTISSFVTSKYRARRWRRLGSLSYTDAGIVSAGPNQISDPIQTRRANWRACTSVPANDKNALTQYCRTLDTAGRAGDANEEGERELRHHRIPPDEDLYLGML